MECNKHNPRRVKPLDEEFRCMQKGPANTNNHRKRLTQGCTSLMYACQQGHTGTIVKELRTKPESVRLRDRRFKSALHYCTGQRDLVAAASVAVAAPELLESADEDGFTPLHLAVIQGNMAMVNLLLANKADVNALDNEGHSVVHWATVCGEVEALRSVLTAGAIVATPDINGGSPLHYAAQMCGANYEGKLGQTSSKLALEILDILIAHPNSSVNVADKDGRQPLLWAASAGSAKAMIALVKAGARVESADKDGLTALHCAASRGHTECIDTLISLCGAPTDLIDSNGCTALHYSVTLGHADATSRLLDLEADPNRQDRKGRTPAHCGCAKGQFETVKLLKERGANLWLRNAKGDLPVHEAASSGRRELVEWLLEQKPKQVNTTSNDGRTFLHIASSNDYTDMCKMLLDIGADVNCIYRNSKGFVMTPLDCALQKGYRSTAKFLQSNGGLPASKLRLSARRPNAFNDQELVKPLKYAEKEDIQDLKTGKKYVVYVKRSDSESGECSCSEHLYRKQHKVNHVCRHHRKRVRRRTSSCGEADDICKDDSCSDISRSKSNIEIRRKRSKDRIYSSDEENSCENCCRHKKKFKRIRRRGKSIRRIKESVASPTELTSMDEHEKLKKKHDPKSESALVAPPEEPTDKAKSDTNQLINPPTRPSSSARKRPQSAKKKKKQDDIVEASDAPSIAPQQIGQKLEAFDQTDEDEIQKSETVITEVEVHKADEPKDEVDEKIATVQAEVMEKVSEEVNSVLNDAATAVESLVDGSSSQLQNHILEAEETTKNAENEDEPKAVSITEQNETTAEVEDKKETEVDSKAMIETTAPPIVEITTVANDEQKEAEPSSTVPPLQILPQASNEDPVNNEPLVANEPEPNDPQTTVKSESRTESRRSFTLIAESPEAKTPRKSSFTILKSDESVDVEEVADGFKQEERHSFHLVEDKLSKSHSDADYTSEEIEEEDDPGDTTARIKRIAGGTSRFMRHSAGGSSAYDHSGRKRRLKKRTKTVEKSRMWTSEGGAAQHQTSKDQDSGFEPSPRTLKTKIPSPRSVHTAMLPRRPIYATLDGRSCSSRLENRKLGDRNACNMTAVTKSIQRNIRRYYMERKIFQHLLELKSLQIRSSKLNESVLVKRAVDDYHKSCMALGAETGGTLRRYPYSEYTFKNFEMFLYETLKSLQKSGTYNFQNINEVYQEAERRLSPDYNAYEKALHCTTKTHRCLHAAHAYTGIPCAAYIPMMNHHTMPKYGFGPYKKTGLGSFYLPKILTSHSKSGSKVSLELSHGKNKQLISLPSDKLDSNKRYYVTFTVKGTEPDGKVMQQDTHQTDSASADRK